MQRTIQKRKSFFENKSLEIESYLADKEEQEKQWLEQEDTVKAEEPKSVQPPVPILSNLPRTSESNDTQWNIQKLPTGRSEPVPMEHSTQNI